MIFAGALDQQITIQQKGTPVRGAQGDEVVTWSTFATVDAKAMPIRGQEYVQLRAQQSDLSIRFLIRYVTGVSTSMRVLWNSNAYDIVEMIPGGTRNATELILVCNGASSDA
jgi:SPP1 family predicted phage head-tail adaptor